MIWPHIALAIGLVSAAAVYGVGLWWADRKLR